jgi:hypothetical protein
LAAHLRCVVQDYLFTALYLVPSAIALYALAHRRYRPFSRFPRRTRARRRRPADHHERGRKRRSHRSRHRRGEPVTEVRARLANEQGWRDGLDAEALTPEEAESLRTHADAYSAALVELLEMFEYPTESFPSDPWQQY